MKIIKTCFAMLFILFFTSCELDDGINTSQNQNPNSTTFSENFGNEISRDFLGTIVDLNGSPIENAMVSIGSSSTTTDSQGIFIINDATVNQRFGYIKAEKMGYIHASRAVVPTEGTNKIRIMMLPETVVGTTSSGTQETISLSNGASVALDGDYIKPDGTVYDGNVNIIMHHLDPADDNMEDQMPGMLYASNAQNEERMLQTFGMLAIELRGENGEDLNLAENSSAEIKVPLDESLVANAPNTIPLWYFDETNGYWIEEGEATLVDNQYVGTVTHFSFWNCDIPAEAVNLCITVVDADGNDLNGVSLDITSLGFGTTNGITNHKGEVCGLVPANEILDVNANLGVCTQSINSIGPFLEDASVTIVINENPDFATETVIGNFNGCDEQSIANGYVLIGTGGNSFYETIIDGYIETTVVRCTNEENFTIQFFDSDNGQESGVTIIPYTSPVTDIGNLSVCEYIEYTIDGTEHFTFNNIQIAELEYNLDDQSFPIETYLIQIETAYGNFPEEDCFRLIGILTQDFNTLVGSYDYWYFQDPNDNMGITFNGDDCGHAMTLDNTALFNINSIGEVGEYIDITFELDYFDFNGQPHTMEGSIHVLRDPNL
ncbi:carboxypeptidase-like regulatory domain-containing protein [Psychroserpens luteolus]|uniref:carboxypeptidase-like regulatory domain-containing protein n=1 Tax=Psychroserpens luteolus TaxID=2855840 RepID=UPI001E4A2336|nr:carboxypeptidase-like regulatory domain-containing protein [Psychroserpens luteolus]MCD2260731.1 carboxypeptidase-like regulatory domain-containing protein [Psychroserpens luteolus]